MKRGLPIGIQDFEKLRKARCIYVDKTALIYELVQTETPLFLARPCRFGKSLLCSTLRSYKVGAVFSPETRNLVDWKKSEG